MFAELFDVFSRRRSVSNLPSLKPITKEFRNRVMMLLHDHLQGSFEYSFEHIHRQVAYLHGRPELTKAAASHGVAEDLAQFMFACKDEDYLDVIEVIFKSHSPGIGWPDNPLISAINELFRFDNLPYHLTEYMVEHEGATTRLTGFPKIIRKDCDATHQRAIEPALHLLSSAEFKHANSEFLKALEDFRKGDFCDCLTKCGSSFESTMKVLCKRRAASFKETDAAAALLRSLMAKGTLDTFWEQPLMLIATLRNRLSSSHGAGSIPKVVPEHVAAYAVNVTAAAILLLITEHS